MEDFDLKQYILDDIRQSEPDDFDEVFQRFLDTHGNCFERPLLEIPVPLIPPDPCPATPSFPDIICDTRNEQDLCKENYQTDSPELKCYLKKINPLEKNSLKRKSDNSALKNQKTKVPRITGKEKCSQRRRQSVDGVSCISEKFMRWENFNCEKLYELYDSSSVIRKPPFLTVTCDKGILLSPVENIYISQKKNHFQITIVLENVPETESFIKVGDAYEEVFSYKVHLYAVKTESPCNKISIEQSTADRCKRQYSPVRFPAENVEGARTLTIGRLHFSETTTNNMRKKGMLNPDQRYFLLIVDVCAYSEKGVYSICRQASEKIIVRASNPGQFETDAALWSKGKQDESINRTGNVGINNNKPEHSLSVNGDIRLTGQVLQPADERLFDFKEQVDTSEKLENIANLKIYKYLLSKEYMQYAGLNVKNRRENIGLLGNNVEEFIPDAVTHESSITFPGGKSLKDVHLIDKDRLLMESLGAIQELYKILQFLTSRLMELEKERN